MTISNLTHRNMIDPKFLRVDQLGLQLGRQDILKDVSFTIRSDEFVGIIGPNGAGKSSLLHCLYKKYIPTSGQINFKRRLLSNYSRQQLAQEMAVVLQQPNTHFALNVFDVIRMGLTPSKSIFSFDNDADIQSIQQAAAHVGLSKLLTHSFETLSGGEKQRTMIAMAMVQNPSLLIMDEPTNYLDVQHQISILELAHSMQICVLVSMHDLNLAAAFCDQLILLNKGEIVTQGTPKQVLTEQNLRTVFGVKALIDQHPMDAHQRITFKHRSN